MRSAATLLAISRYPKKQSKSLTRAVELTLINLSSSARLGTTKMGKSEEEDEILDDDEGGLWQEEKVDDEITSPETPSPIPDRDSTYEPSPVKQKRLSMLQHSSQQGACAVNSLNRALASCVQRSPPSLMNLQPLSKLSPRPLQSSYAVVHRDGSPSHECAKLASKSQCKPLLSSQRSPAHSFEQRTMLLPLRPSPQKICRPNLFSTTLSLKPPSSPVTAQPPSEIRSLLSISSKRRHREVAVPKVPAPYRIRPDEPPELTPGQERKQRFLRLRTEQDRQLEQFERERQELYFAKDRMRGTAPRYDGYGFQHRRGLQENRGRKTTPQCQGSEEYQERNTSRHRRDNHKGVWEAHDSFLHETAPTWVQSRRR